MRECEAGRRSLKSLSPSPSSAASFVASLSLEREFLSMMSRILLIAWCILSAVDGFVPSRSPFSLIVPRGSCHPKKEFKMTSAEEIEEKTTRVSNELDLELDPVKRFRIETYTLVQAALIGILSGWSVGLFKLAIGALKEVSYGFSSSALYRPLVPALGGFGVGILSLAGPFSPGLVGCAKELDDFSRQTPKERASAVKRPLRYFRKTAASVISLGTGTSLGPEGPAVEVGMSMSRILLNIFPSGPVSNLKTTHSTLQRNRLLLSCGAAAGVAVGFNAPIAGVFFSLEIVQRAFEVNSKKMVVNGATNKDLEVENPTSVSNTISALLLSSVLAALVSDTIWGKHEVLKWSSYTLQAPLMELPVYLGLGATCGVVAFAFSQTAKKAQLLFDGKLGPNFLRNALKSAPQSVKPVIGGLICGLIGIYFPQILFFGEETLNSLLANSPMPTAVLISLLGVKTLSTALAAGSGLVGGTFAPSLFLGATTGAAFWNVMTALFRYTSKSNIGVGGPALILADLPAYTMVGAASVLAALYRAPLTASMLMFELTKDYDVILPLMASAGIGSILADIIEAKVERKRLLKLRRDRDSVSWGDLADKEE